MLGGAPHLQRVALKGSSRQAGRVYGGRPAETSCVVDGGGHLVTRAAPPPIHHKNINN